MQTRIAHLLGVVSICLLAGCQTYPAGRDDWLYQQLGERQGISQLVEQEVLNIAQDPRIAGYFVDTDIARLHRLLTEQICDISGGPCTYTGRDMYDIHTGMGVTEAAFNALVDDLIDAMNRQDIPVGAQNQLLALLAPMHKDIVNTPAPPTEIVGDGVGVKKPTGYSAKPLNKGL